jgi:hypothetical protein
MNADGGGVVLAAVDGSAEAADGVVVAGQLARAWNGELHLVHVWSGHAPPLTAVVAECGRAACSLMRPPRPRAEERLSANSTSS